MTSMQRNDVASTSFRRHVPNRFLINQCQIITFLILKYDIIENSRIELRGIVLPVQIGGLLGGPKGMLAPPLKLLGGLAPPPPGPPLPTPMNRGQSGDNAVLTTQYYLRNIEIRIKTKIKQTRGLTEIATLKFRSKRNPSFKRR